MTVNWSIIFKCRVANILTLGTAETGGLTDLTGEVTAGAAVAAGAGRALGAWKEKDVLSRRRIVFSRIISASGPFDFVQTMLVL